MGDCNGLQIKYIVLISIVGVFFFVELIVGLVAHSIILQTDAFHMLSDLLALIIGFAAILVLNFKHHRYTYGWVRAEIIAGLINSVFILAISFMLILENISKFIELHENAENDKLEENIDAVLYVASLGLLINIVGMVLFHNEHSHIHSHQHSDTGKTEDVIVHNHAQSAILLHIIGDTLGSILVIINSLVIKYSDGDWRFYLDPLGSLLIISFMCIGSTRLLIRCMKILMHHWSGDSVGDITLEIHGVEGIDEVHEFHMWSLDSKIAVASMHIKMQPQVTADKIDSILLTVKDILHKRGIHCSAIQPEWTDHCTEPQCRTDCGEHQCCKVHVN